MSWDISLVKLRNPFWSESKDLPDLDAIGEPDNAHQKISEFLAGIEWVEEPGLDKKLRTVGIFETDEGSFEFYGFEARPLMQIHIEGRGSIDPEVQLSSLCKNLGWALIGLSDDGFYRIL